MVYHAQPKAQGKNMAVILFMEAFGVNNHIKDVCHRLAFEGYEVFAPDLYYRLGDNLQFSYSDRESVMEYLTQMSEEDLLQDIRQLVNYLHEDRKIPRLSTLGFCIGGYISLLAAINFPIVSAVSYYGAGVLHERPGFKLRPLSKNLHRIKARPLLFFGELDTSIPLTEVEEISQRLKQSKVPYQMKVLKNATHGFFCEERSSYQAEAAHLSWRMTLDWLNEGYSMAERSGEGDSDSDGTSASV